VKFISEVESTKERYEIMGKVAIPNGVEGEEAVYREQVIREYVGNLYRGSSAIYAPEEVVEKLAVYPPYSEEERISTHTIGYILPKNFFIASASTPAFGFGKQDFKSYTAGYLPRNPVSKEYVISLKDGIGLYRIVISMPTSSLEAQPVVLLLLAYQAWENQYQLIGFCLCIRR